MEFFMNYSRIFILLSNFLENISKNFFTFFIHFFYRFLQVNRGERKGIVIDVSYSCILPYCRHSCFLKT